MAEPCMKKRKLGNEHEKEKALISQWHTHVGGFKKLLTSAMKFLPNPLVAMVLEYFGSVACFLCAPHAVGYQVNYDFSRFQNLVWERSKECLFFTCGDCDGSLEVSAMLLRKAKNATGTYSWVCEGCAKPKIYTGQDEDGCDKVCCPYGYNRLLEIASSEHRQVLTEEDKQDLEAGSQSMNVIAYKDIPDCLSGDSLDVDDDDTELHNQTEEEVKYLEGEGFSLLPDFVAIQTELHESLLCRLCIGHDDRVNFGSVPSRKGLPITCGDMHCKKLGPLGTDDLWDSPPASDDEAD